MASKKKLKKKMKELKKLTKEYSNSIVMVNRDYFKKDEGDVFIIDFDNFTDDFIKEHYPDR